MRNFLIRSAASIALLSGSALSANANSSEMVVFAFDVSDSAPVAIDAILARSAGNYVQSYIEGMAPGDRIKIRTLGTAGVVAQQVYINVNLGKKGNTRPRRIAPQIGSLVRSLPELVRRGKITIQNRTNIIGFLEALGSSLDCQKTPTTIVIFSDGIEWSTQVRGDDLLSGKQNLPNPSGQILKGCAVEIRGLGQQNSGLATDSRWFPLLKSQWTKFFTMAGVSRFAAYAGFE